MTTWKTRDIEPLQYVWNLIWSITTACSPGVYSNGNNRWHTVTYNYTQIKRMRRFPESKSMFLRWLTKTWVVLSWPADNVEIPACIAKVPDLSVSENMFLNCRGQEPVQWPMGCRIDASSTTGCMVHMLVGDRQ
jgi:hypothetical protein